VILSPTMRGRRHLTGGRGCVRRLPSLEGWMDQRWLNPTVNGLTKTLPVSLLLILACRDVPRAGNGSTWQDAETEAQRGDTYDVEPS
jgi:hypothetical protein